jgi:hypothetical protein
MNMEGVSMKINKWSLFWGILLIGFGVRALAQTMGYANVDDPVTWAIVFGGISLLSLVFYFLDGIKSWGWLFPAGIFGALALVCHSWSPFSSTVRTIGGRLSLQA